MSEDAAIYKFAHIDIERTIAEFGYDPRGLKPSSHRLVISFCVLCLERRTQKFGKSKYNKCRSCSLKGRVNSEETRKKISIANRGNRVGIKNHNFGKKMSDEVKAKISESRKGKYCGTEHHGFGKPMSQKAKEGLAKVRPLMKGEKHHRYGTKWTDEFREHFRNKRKGKPGTPMSESLKRRLSEERKGKNNPMFGRPISNTTGSWYERLDGTKIWMRSSWETKFAKFLDESGKNWQYEPKTFEIFLYDEEEIREATYTPDFLVDGKYFEIKGRWTYDGFIKFCHFEHQHPSEKIHLLKRKELKALGIKGIY